MVFVDDSFVLGVDFLHFVLEVLDDVFEVELCVADAECVILYELKHDFEHAGFAFGLAHVVLGLDLDHTLVVVVFLLQADHLHEIALA